MCADEFQQGNRLRETLVEVMRLLKSLGITFSDCETWLEISYSYRGIFKFKAKIYPEDTDTVNIVANYHPNPSSHVSGNDRAKGIETDDNAYKEWVQTLMSRRIPLEKTTN